MKVFGFTGHRAYAPCANGVELRLHALAYALLLRDRPDAGITGMAIGWDLAVSQALVDLEIPLIAAIPFIGQENRWDKPVQVQYRSLLKAAERVVVVSAGGYERWKMQKRNEWIVDNCSRLFALWSGRSGGTKNCWEYAERVGRDRVNLWNSWTKYVNGPSRQ